MQRSHDRVVSNINIKVIPLGAKGSKYTRGVPKVMSLVVFLVNVYNELKALSDRSNVY